MLTVDCSMLEDTVTLEERILMIYFTVLKKIGIEYMVLSIFR